MSNRDLRRAVVQGMTMLPVRATLPAVPVARGCGGLGLMKGSNRKYRNSSTVLFGAVSNRFQITQKVT